MADDTTEHPMAGVVRRCDLPTVGLHSATAETHRDYALVTVTYVMPADVVIAAIEQETRRG